eukprot:m.303003 g.303003  ORF g.303003 m.303003 type:complete len:369 (-) comp16317_c0_seq1:103-1209(-)
MCTRVTQIMTRLTVAIGLLCVGGALVLPGVLERRDRALRVAIPRLLPTPSNRIQREGYVKVVHSEATLARVSDVRGPVPADPVQLYYATTYDQASCPSHVLLLHGTGDNANSWFETSATNPSLRQSRGFDGVSIVDRFHEAGHCVTVIEHRGHGRSDVPPGPYTVPLFAADAHAVMATLFGAAHRYHVVGHSVGFGAALSLGLNYGENVITVAGSGFLSDRTNADFAAWLFSREPVIKAMGMWLLGKAGRLAIQCNPASRMDWTVARVDIDGFARTSASWLHYNEQARIHEMKPPTLYLFPALDSLAGYSVDMFEKDVKLIPKAKLVQFTEPSDEAPTYDHCMPFYRPETYFSPVFQWMAAHADAPSQ